MYMALGPLTSSFSAGWDLTKMWKINNCLFIFYWFYNKKISFFLKDKEKKDGDSRRRTSKETGGSGKEGPKGRDWPNPWIYVSGNLNFPAAKLCTNQVYIRRFEQPISFDLDLVVNDVIMYVNKQNLEFLKLFI